jgi:hypothetical protein
MVFFKGHTANIYCGHVIKVNDDKDVTVSSTFWVGCTWMLTDHIQQNFTAGGRNLSDNFVIVCPD